MIQKRNGAWTVLWALIPGAGHMFCGFMKRGVSLMSMFAVAWVLGFWLDLVPLTAITAVIWFYAFFDCINRRFQNDEAFYAQQDRYLLTPDMLDGLRTMGTGKTRIVLGGVLLALGIYVIWNKLIMDWIPFLLPEGARIHLYNVSYAIPQLLVAGLIIWLSIVLIRDKSKETEEKQEQSEKREERIPPDFFHGRESEQNPPDFVYDRESERVQPDFDSDEKAEKEQPNFTLVEEKEEGWKEHIN